MEPPILEKLPYHQLKTTCKALHHGFPAPPATFHALQNILSTPSAHKLITRLYTVTQTNTQFPDPGALESWRLDLGDALTDEV